MSLRGQKSQSSEYKKTNFFGCTTTPTVYHAAVVIFLEFFAFGLITAPMITVMGFSEESVALFIAMCGLVSCLAQTCGLGVLIGTMGAKRAIIVGLTFEVCQLAMFGFSSSAWILWTAGGVAGLGTITYPALSAFLSNHANSDQQGLTQGLLTGIRGLCGGLGPALYGFIFFIFQVDLNSLLPGPPFAFGAILALTAIITAIFLPEDSRVPTSGPPLDSWDAEDRALIASVFEDTEDGDDKEIQGTENATFVGFYDRRRRPGDKLDLLPHRHLKRSSSPAEGKEHSFLPHILRTRARSRLGFMAAANPLRRIFSSGARVAAPHLSSRDCHQIREELRPAAVEERQSLNPWREATEAADLANYRHHRMQHLFDPHEEARRREAEVASVRAARLAEGQTSSSTNSLLRAAGPLGCHQQHSKSPSSPPMNPGRARGVPAPALPQPPFLVLRCIAETRSRRLLKPDFSESPNFRTPSVSLMARPVVPPTPRGRFAMASQSSPPCILFLGCSALQMGPYRPAPCVTSPLPTSLWWRR
nr:unnamed protein product [Spirometra erinaceieuropaei]